MTSGKCNMIIVFCSMILLLSLCAITIPNRTVSGSVSPQVSAGENYSVVLKSDGTVWAWGWNSTGQLGDGTDEGSNTPVQVSSLSSITAIACGSGHSLALKSDATVWAWGDNQFGQLGDETNNDSKSSVQRQVKGLKVEEAQFDLKSSATFSTKPIQVSGLSGIIAIASGVSHSLALKSDGTVWAWGSNGVGQLGNGTAGGSSSTPVQVSNLSNVTAIACGSGHSLALKSDATVWAWGSNGEGQLGNGTEEDEDSNTPVQVSNLSSVTAIACGSGHSLALKSDATVWAWGDNQDGQLGERIKGSYSYNTPGQVSNLSGVTAIACGSSHSLALKSDGTAWAWGSNFAGQLGDGTEKDRETPVQVSDIKDVIAIEGGTYHSLALRSDGTVWVWGSNEILGDGTDSDSNVPVQAIINLTKQEECEAVSFILSDKLIHFCSSPFGNFLTDNVIVTVSGGDCTVSGERITAKINNAGKKLISISQKSAVTDANGNAKFTITANKKKHGVAKVTFKAGGLKKKTLTVKITKTCK